MTKHFGLLLPFLFLPILFLLPVSAVPSAQFPTGTVTVVYPETATATSTPTFPPTLTATPPAPSFEVPIAAPVFSNRYEQDIHSFAWSPDGKLLAVAHGREDIERNDGWLIRSNVEVWNLEQTRIQTSYAADLRSFSYPLFFTTDSRVIVHSTDFGEVQGYDAQTGGRIYAIFLNEDAYTLYFAPMAYVGNKALLIGSQTKPFPLDLRSGAKLFATNDQMRPPDAVVWSQDGLYLFTLDYESIKAWDGKSGLLLYELPENYQMVKISPDNRLLLESIDGRVHLREVVNGQILNEFSIPGQEIYAGSWHPGSAFFTTGGTDEVILWGVDGSQRILPEKSIRMRGFSPDGRYMHTVNMAEEESIWEVDSLSKVFSMPYGMQGLGWSKDMQFWLAASNNEIYLYNTATWELVQKWASPEKSYGLKLPIQWSPNGQLAAVSWGDRYVEIFSLTNTLDLSAAPTATPSATSTITPIPSSTPTPTSTYTPTPTATPRFQTLLFDEAFNDNTADWETAQGEGIFSGIVEGRYIIEHTAQTNGFGWFVAPGFTDPTRAPIITGDFEMTVNITHITSSTSNYRLTLLIGVQPNYSDYTLINLSLPEGRVTVGDSAEFIRQEGLIASTDFAAHNGGLLGVSVEGQTLTLTLDGSAVFTTQLENLPAGSIGFGLGSVSDEKATVRAEFDNLQIRLP